VKVDLSLYEDPSYPITNKFSRDVATNLAGTMQLFGLSKVSIAFSKHAMSRKVVLNEFSPMDFAPQKLREHSRSFALAVAEVMSAAGIVSISVNATEGQDVDNLKKLWDSDLSSDVTESRLIVPPGVADSLTPIHVSF